FHPWFRKVAVNTCLNFKRDSRCIPVSLSGAEEGEKALEETIASESNVEDEILDAELGRLIKENLELLKPKHRMVMVLRYYEGLSYEEISVLLKEPLGTVKTDIYRAKNALKEKLKKVINL
ncbi:MAG TPA: RNA polymerase sigma factor, partial [Clostridia bacterium]|nr:RNA polymerase sigma factor [Clostridia bacterium]